MSAFENLTEYSKTFLIVLMFIAFVGEQGLFVFKLGNMAPLKNCLRCGVFLVVNAFLLVSMAQKKALCFTVATVFALPWSVIAAWVALSGLHICTAFYHERLRADNTLSKNSIQEGTDDIPMGLCFSDPKGRIVLINKKMRELAGEVFGFYPQMTSEMKEALLKQGKAQVLNGDCVNIGERIYHFRICPITVNGEEGWKQIMAYDVNQQQRGNEELLIETEKLEKINRKIRKMYARMSDDIREKESLALKVYVHDTIGRSILTVQDIMENGDETEQKVQALREAIGVLSSNRTTFAGTLEEVIQTAAKMGINVDKRGYIPRDTIVETLTEAAVRECVTNCIKHAKGNEITVKAEDLEVIYRITVTNNGEKPKEKIVERGGLLSLRRSVEASGGEMSISHYPSFCLVLNIPKKGVEDYD